MRVDKCCNFYNSVIWEVELAESSLRFLGGNLFGVVDNTINLSGFVGNAQSVQNAADKFAVV